MSPRIRYLFSVIVLTTALSAGALAAPSKPEGKAATTSAPTKSAGNLQEIQVTLFGQPCTMSGPFPRASLSQLHEISPEKITPDLSVEQMKKIRTKTGDLKAMPMAIEQYRDHLRKRLSAKIAFEEAVAPAKKAGGKDSRKALETFLTNVKEHISTLQYPGFVDATKKAFEAGGATWNEAFLASLRERFEGVIQSETEEEFHKAIRAAKIQYVCAFDDSDHRAGEVEDE